VLVHDFDRRDPGGQQPKRVIGVALDLGPKAVGSGDDETEIADLRDVDPRIVDFVDDTEAEREP
jgi:hypothetical protein